MTPGLSHIRKRPCELRAPFVPETAREGGVPTESDWEPEFDIALGLSTRLGIGMQF